MDNFIQNVLLIFAICFIVYIVFRGIRVKTYEGLTMPDAEETDPGINNYGGNAGQYVSHLKTKLAKMHDRALISKYRPDYENVVMHLDEMADHLMFQTAMSVDHKNPNSATETLHKIATLNHSKAGLNNIMKFIDGK
jgi:hypothetical protein